MKRGIYLIWDLPAAHAAPREFFTALGQDLPCAVQLRAKGARQRPAVLSALIEACNASSVPLFVNDHPEWVVAGVAGVHLGQDDGVAPGVGGQRIGRSTHDLEQVKVAADDARVSYLGFGPIYPTASKADALPARGVRALEEAVLQAQGKPVVAIGGIKGAHVRQVKASGAWAAAVISAVWSSPDPVASLRELVRGWESA